MKPHRCPVCYGTGYVPAGFYLHPGGYPYSTSSVAPEPCQSCGGCGVLWEPEEKPAPLPATVIHFSTELRS